MAYKIFVAIKALDLSLHRVLADGLLLDDNDNLVVGSHDLAVEILFTDTTVDIHQNLADISRTILGTLASLDLSVVKVYFTDSPGHY